MVQRCSGEKKRNPSAGLSGKGGFYRMKTRSDKEEEKAKRGTFTPGLSLGLYKDPTKKTEKSTQATFVL